MPCTSNCARRPDYCSSRNAYESCADRHHQQVDESNSSCSSSSCDGWPEYADNVSSSSSLSSAKDEKRRAVHGKWLKTLWSVIDCADPQAERRKQTRRAVNPPPPRPPVKTILRPPTEYVYVIGMSGLPSKVAVYPKRP